MAADRNTHSILTARFIIILLVNESKIVNNPFTMLEEECKVHNQSHAKCLSILSHL